MSTILSNIDPIGTVGRRSNAREMVVGCTGRELPPGTKVPRLQIESGFFFFLAAFPYGTLPMNETYPKRCHVRRWLAPMAGDIARLSLFLLT